MKQELDTRVNVYITENKDTWDKISYKVYGHGKMTMSLMNENPDFSKIVIFSDGIMIICPDEINPKREELPEWID